MSFIIEISEKILHVETLSSRKREKVHVFCKFVASAASYEDFVRIQFPFYFRSVSQENLSVYLFEAEY